MTAPRPLVVRDRLTCGDLLRSLAPWLLALAVAVAVYAALRLAL